jgi:hypothetical protein
MKLTKREKRRIEAGKAEVYDKVISRSDVTMGHLAFATNILNQMTPEEMKKLVFDNLYVDVKIGGLRS